MTAVLPARPSAWLIELPRSKSIPNNPRPAPIETGTVWRVSA